MAMKILLMSCLAVLTFAPAIVQAFQVRSGGISVSTSWRASACRHRWRSTSILPARTLGVQRRHSGARMVSGCHCYGIIGPNHTSTFGFMYMLSRSTLWCTAAVIRELEHDVASRKLFRRSSVSRQGSLYILQGASRSGRFRPLRSLTRKSGTRWSNMFGASRRLANTRYLVNAKSSILHKIDLDAASIHVRRYNVRSGRMYF